MSTSKNNAVLPKSAQIKISDDGSVTIFDDNSLPIRDEAVIRKIKKTAQYKQTYTQLMEEIKDNIMKRTDEFINIHQLSAFTPTFNDFKNSYDEIKEQKYIKKEYLSPPPDIESIKQCLYEEARTNDKSIAFWNRKKICSQYVEKNIETKYNQIYNEWLLDKKRHEAAESIKEEERTSKKNLRAKNQI